MQMLRRYILVPIALAAAWFLFGGNDSAPTADGAVAVEAGGTARPSAAGALAARQFVRQRASWRTLDPALTASASAFFDAALAGNDDEYLAALDALRERSVEVADMLYEEYRRVPLEQSADRWLLVFGLSELEEPTALPLFGEILADPIPEGDGSDEHLFSARREEISIRLRAVAGVEQLALSGDAAAGRLLLDTVEVGTGNVRTEAVLAYLEVGGGSAEARDAVRGRLHPDDYYLLDLERVTESPNPQE